MMDHLTYFRLGKKVVDDIKVAALKLSTMTQSFTKKD